MKHHFRIGIIIAVQKKKIKNSSIKTSIGYQKMN